MTRCSKGAGPRSPWAEPAGGPEARVWRSEPSRAAPRPTFVQFALASNQNSTKFAGRGGGPGSGSGSVAAAALAADVLALGVLAEVDGQQTVVIDSPLVLSETLTVGSKGDVSTDLALAVVATSSH